jgi:hypothetical protein
MLNTYKAIVRRDQQGHDLLEWSEGTPEDLAEDRPVKVSVTILEPSAGQGERMADALEKLAQLNIASAIKDPAAWEREQREDRDLPCRNS